MSEPKVRRPIDVLIQPLRTLFEHQLAGAALLLGAAVVAIVWANSPWAHAYHHLLELEAGIDFGEGSIHKSLHHWINDGLMGIFFFTVGLEIKREFMAGELSSLRKATLPAVAAVGGMVVPALLYFALNQSGPGSEGWGIPMATDIAFALGVLAVLGDRVSLGLKVFLTALAIVDDIGAVLVIAVFYTEQVSLVALSLGVGFFALALIANRLQVRSAVVYFVIGSLVWLSFLESGVHATVASILMAFTIPARTRLDGESFMHEIQRLLADLRRAGLPRRRQVNSPEQQVVLELMDEAVEEASAPLQELLRVLDPWVTFLVLPVFALANAGVTVGGDLLRAFVEPVTLGVMVGLFLGKQIGIAVFAWLAVKLRVADLPQKVNWGQLYGVAVLGGIGFTMSLFIASLAFPGSERLEHAKVGVLAASMLSGVVGLAIIYWATPRERAAAEAG